MDVTTRVITPTCRYFAVTASIRLVVKCAHDVKHVLSGCSEINWTCRLLFVTIFRSFLRCTVHGDRGGWIAFGFCRLRIVMFGKVVAIIDRASFVPETLIPAATACKVNTRWRDIQLIRICKCTRPK